MPVDLVQAGLTARKSLGQHFLVDRRILGRIVSAAKLSPEDTVVEVGPGLGVLTKQLANFAGRVIAGEVDKGLYERLQERFAGVENLSLIQGDILSLTPSDLLQQAAASAPYAVVANLPYNIAAPVLRRFLEAAEPPQRLVVMVQREVAESIVAAPGRMSLLAASVQFYAVPELLFVVPPSAFRPPPRVDSAVLRIDVRERPAVEVDNIDVFFHFLRAGFSAPRKQLRNALGHTVDVDMEALDAAFAASGIDPTLRAQALALDDWARLYAALREATQ